MRSLKTLLLASVIALSATFATAQSFVTNGLVCYYPFDGNTLDASGNGNNPTSVVATPAPDRFGNPTNALAFDGVTSGIVTSGFFNQAALKQTIYQFGSPETVPSDLTESIWFCPSNNLSITNLYYLVCDGSPSGSAYDSALYDGGMGLSAYVYTFSGGYSAFTSQTNFASNVWYHVVGVITSTNVQVYLNGTLQDNISSIGYRQFYGNLNIGAQQWSSGGYRFGFAGRLDDVRVYNRAFSSNEVSELYALEQPLPSIGLAYAYVPTFSNLTVGSAYQLQVSSTANGVFTNYGDPFTATNISMSYPGYFIVTNAPQLYFRFGQ